MRALATLLLTVLAWSGLAAAEYAIDVGHSALLFSTQHVGLGNTWGRFNEFSGSVTWDAANPTAGSVNLTAQVASVDTGLPARDNHLRQADILDAAAHPTMSFVGTGFTPLATADHYAVTGTFTLHGVSREITVNFRKVGEGKTPDPANSKPAVGFEGEFTINPVDYGIGKGPIAQMLAPVRIIVAIEAVAK
jgi:polyisoprenoid-binding protein YceI